MTRNNKLKSFLAVSLLALMGGATSVHASTVKEWNLKVQPGSLVRSSDMIGLRNGLTEGSVKLFQDGAGAYSVRMVGTTVNSCLNVEVDARVEKTEETTSIFPAKRFASCPELRFVIKNDGSGGTVQSNVGRRGAVAWQTDEDHDYDLTPR